MPLYCEKLGGGKTCFFFIHGWGFSRNIWREQALLMAVSHSVMLVDLPGFGRSPFEEWRRFDELAAPLSELVSGHGFSDVILVGWSLGASMAAKMALRWGDRAPTLRGLVMVGSSPSYTNPPNEKFAVDEIVYKKTLRNLKKKYPESFHDLAPMLLGKTLIKGSKIPSQKSLIQSLELFHKESLFNVLPRINIPSMVIHGGKDAVFSEKAGRFVSSMLPESRFILFPNDGHAPFLESKEQFHKELLIFYKLTHNTAKKNIKRSFSEAHATYDKEACYQKTTGRHLVDIFLERKCEEANILDVGTGTGFLASEVLYKTDRARVAGCDISVPMLNRAIKNTCIKSNNVFSCIASDADFLSFREESFNWVLSNMMYHWVENLYIAFQEVFRVLQSDGNFLFSVAANGTLKELKEAYEITMGRYYPLAYRRAFHAFPERGKVETAIDDAGFKNCEVFSELIEVPYKSMGEMLRSFKKLGALNPGKIPRGGLLGKQFIERLAHCYAELTNKEKIVGRYRVLYVLANK